MLKIQYHKRAIKQIKRLPLGQRERIAKKISSLKKRSSAKSLNIKRYSKTQNSWRLKIGKIRVIYQLDSKRKLILIRKVGHRGDIYKR